MAPLPLAPWSKSEQTCPPINASALDTIARKFSWFPLSFSSGRTCPAVPTAPCVMWFLNHLPALLTGPVACGHRETERLREVTSPGLHSFLFPQTFVSSSFYSRLCLGSWVKEPEGLEENVLAPLNRLALSRGMFF